MVIQQNFNLSYTGSSPVLLKEAQYLWYCAYFFRGVKMSEKESGKCPKCGSNVYEIIWDMFDGDRYEITCECDECSYEWVEVYKYISWRKKE